MNRTISRLAVLFLAYVAGAYGTTTLTAATSTVTSGATDQFSLQVDSSLTPSTAQVIWSVYPALGTITNSGLFTAQSGLTTYQDVKVIAYVAPRDPGMAPLAAYMRVTLKPVSISVSPTSASLNQSGTTQFNATVTGSSNTAVTWSISPQAGTITASGLYTAPATISGAQNVIVKATSVADKTKSASAIVSLTPAPVVSVSISPASASLGQSGTGQFTATVSGSSNTAVTWSISPLVGTISTSGLYTAPSAISVSQVVTVKAVSAADSTKSSSATVTLNPPAQQPSALVMPIEVMGTTATTQSVQAAVPAGANVVGASLWLQVHGLEYQTQASVKVNSSAWIALSDANVKVQGLAAKYGGIGGGFGALSLLVPLPAGTVQAGANTVSFAFNGTDGQSSGFRVLDFNLQAADGTKLIPASAFSQDDPSAWTAPSNLASDIAAGQALYQTATLTQPVGGGSPQTLKAHCGDCHTKDGRDLKYFNYSNQSIYVRSQFHGMNDTQANQLVSYIRSLTTPAPANARPWNPPYQPGPGLDSQPVANWSAGAGLSSVLASDAAMLPYVAPTQTAADFDPNGSLNIRETPIPYQMLDWNHWLPRIHPVDAYGSAFLSSTAYGDYRSISAALVPNSAQSYQSQQYNIDNWSGDTTNFRSAVEPSQNDSSWSNAQTAEKVYGIQQWQIVKLWEINQAFGLEGMAQSVFGSQADSRAWFTNAPFQTSPSIGKIPPGAPGIHNGSVTTFNNVSFLWYYLQLILNNGNKRQACSNPVDYGYFYGFISDQGRASSPQAMLYLAVMQKGLQESNNGYGPQYGCSYGWNWGVNDPSFLVQVPNLSSSENVWAGVPAGTRAALINSYMTQWLATLAQFTPQQFYASGQTSSTESLDQSWYGGAWAGRVAFMIPRLKYLGMTQALATQLSNWANGMWPGHNWSAFANASCTNSGGDISCSSDPLM